MTLNNTVIKVLNEEHGKRVIEFWKSQGVDTNGYNGECIESLGNCCIYYGVINGNFENYSYDQVLEAKARIATLEDVLESKLNLPVEFIAMLDNMQYYMEYCQNNDYVTPLKWLTELKHFSF